MLQVVEDDLVAARQADRSLGSQDLSRFEDMNFGNLVSSIHIHSLIYKILQMADHGPPNIH